MLCFLDSDEGRLFVFGRKGDVISRGIVLIYPAWIERPISAHPHVLEVMAVPVPDDVNIQNVCVCLVKQPDSDLSGDDVKEYLRTTMTDGGNGLFVVDHVLFFEDQLPNLSRVKLGELAAEKLALK
ncbi:unnamed protein product [Lymnaea stagnalis]|uniref:AMP-binding enzyme C-terminal domain-containing protein n=1 Tax=Lymnaea stagnalis TaxID=6523 RepID=A0AAV2I5I8_LYMST